MGDALVGEVAEPVEGEDGLDDDRAAEQETELHGAQRHHRHDGVAQRVLEDDLQRPDSPLARAVRM